MFADINGVKQGMFIKSKNDKNPGLLYLHGGMLDYFLSEQYPTGLEDYFTVVGGNSVAQESPTAANDLRYLGSCSCVSGCGKVPGGQQTG